MEILRHLTGPASLIALSCGSAFAQNPATFPSKPITVVLATEPGATVDIETRLYTQKVSESLKNPVVLEYKTGGGQTIAIGYVSRATPDGHTLLAITSTFTIIPSLFKDLQFDPIKSFEPVSLVSKQGYVVVASAAFPPKTFQEYVAYAKANPGKINYGTAGAGGTTHVLAEWMHALTDSNVTYIHYRGGSPAYAAVLSGQVDVVYANTNYMLPHAKSGKVKALAVTGTSRSMLYPEVPTVQEQGAKDFEFSSWLAYVAPARTPTAVINKLSGEFAKAARQPDVVKKLAASDSTPIGRTPEELRKTIAAEIPRWAKVVRDANITLAD